jgi:hypothetical protein
MIDREHNLPLTKQAEAAGLARSTVYYLPRPASAADLELMRQIDRLHLEFPFAGARMLRGPTHAVQFIRALFFPTNTPLQIPLPKVSYLSAYCVLSDVRKTRFAFLLIVRTVSKQLVELPPSATPARMPGASSFILYFEVSTSSVQLGLSPFGRSDLAPTSAYITVHSIFHSLFGFGGYLSSGGF